MGSFKLLPSIDRLLSGAVAAAKRFPLALACGAMASIISVIIIENREMEKPSELVNLTLTLYLGISLFIALTLLGETRNWSVRSRIIAPVIGVLALALYFISLPLPPFHPASHAVRLPVLAFGLHFLVAIVPFFSDNTPRRFWQFNKSLLIGGLTSAFYSAALFVGLAIALAASDYLFGFDVKGDTYGELLVLMAGIVNTWIFLTQIPGDLKSLESDDSYPVALKIFSQYVLLPLVGLYFAILFAYEIKIIAQWNWPKGWVSQLVLWYSVVGILALLLLNPLREREGSRWIGKFSDWYFRLSVPLVVMLFLAIRRRIADYGVTEPRYIVLGLAIGLSAVVLYFIFSKRKDIRSIPIVLVILAALAAYGPLSASSVSVWSQSSRLSAMLIENGLYKDGALQKSDKTIAVDTRRQMSSIVDYLNEFHSPEVFGRWIPDSLLAKVVQRYESQEKPGNFSGINDTIARLLGFEYNWSRYYSMDGKYVSLWTKDPHILDIGGFDKMLLFTYPPNDDGDSVGVYKLDGFTCRAELLPNSAKMSIGLSGAESSEITFDLAPRVEQLYLLDNSMAIPQDSLTFDTTVGQYRVRLFVQSLSGLKSDSVLDLTNLRTKILVRRLP